MVLFNLLLIVDVVYDTLNEIMSFCLSCHFTQSKFALIKSFFPQERYNVPTIETETSLKYSGLSNDLKGGVRRRLKSAEYNFERINDLCDKNDPFTPRIIGGVYISMIRALVEITELISVWYNVSSGNINTLHV